MAAVGGAFDRGTIFTFDPNDSSFAELHSFAGSTSDGAYPSGSPFLATACCTGMTNAGGAGAYGTIFRINTDGSGFAVLHSFAYGEGASPHGSLTFAGGVLYGMTNTGVPVGTARSSRSTPTAPRSRCCTHLRRYNRRQPTQGSLTLEGSVLYGMTYGGGASGTARSSRSTRTAPDFPCCTLSPVALATASYPGVPHRRSRRAVRHDLLWRWEQLGTVFRLLRCFGVCGAALVRVRRWRLASGFPGCCRRRAVRDDRYGRRRR